MSRNRFQKILQRLHFADKSNYDANDPNRDRPYKVRDVVGLLVSRFKTVYLPTKSMSIDEEVLLWKEKLSFKQYIRIKRARFGTDFDCMFLLCHARVSE